jgi:hypothetical protein
MARQDVRRNRARGKDQVKKMGQKGSSPTQPESNKARPPASLTLPSDETCSQTLPLVVFNQIREFDLGATEDVEGAAKKPDEQS